VDEKKARPMPGGRPNVAKRALWELPVDVTLGAVPTPYLALRQPYGSKSPHAIWQAVEKTFLLATEAAVTGDRGICGARRTWSRLLAPWRPGKPPELSAQSELKCLKSSGRADRLADPAHPARPQVARGEGGRSQKAASASQQPASSGQKTADEGKRLDSRTLK
jgi:hypothetical protein